MQYLKNYNLTIIKLPFLYAFFIFIDYRKTYQYNKTNIIKKRGDKMTKKLKKYLLLVPIVLLTACNQQTSSSSSTQPQIEDVPQHILETLKGDLALEIELEKSSIDKETDVKSNVEQTKMKTYISSDEYWNYEYTDEKVINESHYFKNAKGNVSEKHISMDNQSIIEEEVLLYGETTVFSTQYYNPFQNLTKSRIQKINDTTYTIADLTDLELEAIHGQLTLYYGKIATLDIIVDKNGAIDSLTYEAYYDYGDYATYLISYEFTCHFTTKQDLGVKEIKVKSHEDYHNALQEKLDLLKNQDYAFTYTKIDPEGIYEDEIFQVVVNKDIIYVHHTENEVTDEYGYMNTVDGFVEFVVEKEGDTVYFNALGKEDPSKNVSDLLVDFELTADVFAFDGINYYLETGYGLYSYLDHFLPNQGIDGLDDANSVDDGSLTLTLNEDQMNLNYTTSGNLWEINVTVTQFNNAKIPYDNYVYQPFSNPTSWEEMGDFYTDLLEMMDESLIAEIPFYYPENGWDTAMVMSFMNTAMLNVDFSTAEEADDVCFDYIMDLIMSGFMMSETDMDTYEKSVGDKTIAISAYCNENTFNLYIVVS